MCSAGGTSKELQHHSPGLSKARQDYVIKSTSVKYWAPVLRKLFKNLISWYMEDISWTLGLSLGMLGNSCCSVTNNIFCVWLYGQRVFSGRPLILEYSRQYSRASISSESVHSLKPTHLIIFFALKWIYGGFFCGLLARDVICVFIVLWCVDSCKGKD